MSGNKPRVLMTNNYDMPIQRRLWLEEGGRRPNHHLWGMVQMERAGYKTACIPFSSSGWISRLSHSLKIIGDIKQQWHALTHINDYDVLYSAHQNPLLFLAFLRRLGLFPKPIISVLHRSYGRSLGAKGFVALALRGYDGLMTVTKGVAAAMHANGDWDDSRLTALPWGLDLPAFDSAIEGVTTETDCNRHFMSAGKTHRDFGVLVSAFQNRAETLRIYHSTDNASAMAAKISAADASNISFCELSFADWRDISRINKSAYAVLIPLDLTNAATYANGFGMTSLLDAIGAGRPVIMTRTPYPVIDIEEEGIGLFVDGDDPDQWNRAVTRLASCPDEADAMGRRARQLCENTYNIEVYAKGLIALIEAVHAKGAAHLSCPPKTLPI